MKIFLFAGSKEDPNWYYSECRLSKPYIGFKDKKMYCYFFADHLYHIGACNILSLKQLFVLPFKHRLYFTEKTAKKRQHKNWLKTDYAKEAYGEK